MEDKKKKFIAPEAEVVDFTMDDIITASDVEDWYAAGASGDGEDW